MMKAMGAIVCVVALVAMAVAPAWGYTYVPGTDYWQASTDWTAGTNPDNDHQGTAGVWAYQYNTNDADFDPANHINLPNWTGSIWNIANYPNTGYYCQVTSSGGHPEAAQDSIRTWTSPVYGKVQITGTLSNTNGGCGDGIRGTIHQGTTQIWTGDAMKLDSVPINTTAPHDVTVEVNKGDKLCFRVNPKAEQGCDGYSWNPRIDYLAYRTYQAGDYWRVSRDWTANTNPDDDYYGTPSVWNYQSAPRGDTSTTAYVDMPYWTGSEWHRTNATTGATDSGYYCRVSSTGGHVEQSYDAVRTWTSPVAGMVRISGSVQHANSACGNGLLAYAMQGTNQIWSADMPKGGSANYNYLARVTPGEKIYLRIDSKGQQSCDSYNFDPTITYLDTVSYQVGDTWRPAQDWTPGQNPDDDAFGTPVWRYQYNPDETDFNPASNLDMAWRGSYWSAAPSGAGGYARWYVDGGGHADDAADPILAWTSPISGTVTLSGTLINADGGGGDGVVGYVHQGTTQLWTGAAPNGGSAPALNTTVRVRPGDQLFFRVNSGVDQGYDTFDWNPQVAYVAPYGLVGEWLCNEGTGNTAADSSGANWGSGGLPINFTNFSGGAGWASPGVDPNVFALSGSALRIPIDGQVTPDRAFVIPEGHRELTLEAWVRYEGSATPDRYRQVFVDSSGATMLFLQQGGSGDDTYWRACASTLVDVGGINSWAQASGDTPLEPDRWYQLAMTYDGTQTKLYLDGVLEATADLVGTMSAGNKWFRLGYSGDGWEADGYLDYMRMWDYALSGEEIMQHYLQVKPEPATMLLLGSGVVVLWRRRRRSR